MVNRKTKVTRPVSLSPFPDGVFDESTRVLVGVPNGRVDG